jgi:hypothetical protein
MAGASAAPVSRPWTRYQLARALSRRVPLPRCLTGHARRRPAPRGPSVVALRQCEQSLRTTLVPPHVFCSRRTRPGRPPVGRDRGTLTSRKSRRWTCRRGEAPSAPTRARDRRFGAGVLCWRCLFPPVVLCAACARNACGSYMCDQRLLTAVVRWNRRTTALADGRSMFDAEDVLSAPRATEPAPH